MEEMNNTSDSAARGDGPASRGPAPKGDPAPQGSEGSGGGSASGSSGSASSGGNKPGGGGPPKRRRRGKRGGRRHNKNRAGGQGAGEGQNGGQGAGEGQNGGSGGGEGQNGGSGGGSGRGQRQALSSAAKASSGDSSGDEDKPKQQGSGNRRRRRRRSSTRSGSGGEGQSGSQKTGQTGKGRSDSKTADQKGNGGGNGNGDADGNGDGEKKSLSSAELAAAGATRLAARKLREEQRKSRGRGRRPRRLTEADAQRLKGKPKTMLIHDHEERTQIAILEEGELIEHYVSRRGQRGTMVGNIYLGKVQNVLAGMEAAFVDFGRGRNGIIYANEISFSEEDLDGDIPRIEKALKSGQKMLVQVTKDPIGTKGARLTTQVTVAGRYLVLAPDQDASGVSRRLADRERQRLRKILADLNPPAEHGIIVRTAADGATAEAIAADLRSLLKRWDEITKRMKGAKAPTPLYEEPELIMRVVRDIFADDFKQVVCDSRRVFDEIRGYLQEAAPDLVDKVSLHEGALPLLEEHRVSEQLHKSLERKVWLPSGGSLIFEKTEAMTVIDVNTGKFTGKGNLEDTVFKNNCEAADEIARQLRLRDIGGIIIIDFIDMIDPKNQKEVLKTLKKALATDKTKSQVFDVSNLGLVEMTRKRVSEGLIEAFSETCPNCDGRGIVVQHRID
ncbi:MAG: Rne/Rng family ribonuclease [Actinomycetota bacterium]